MVEEERVLSPIHILIALELAVPPPHRVVEPFGLVNVTVLGQPLEHVSALRISATEHHWIAEG